MAIIFSLCVYFRQTLSRPLSHGAGVWGTQGLSFYLALVRRMTLPFPGYRLLWLVPKLEGGWGQARWDGGFSIPHWWNVDIKAGASAAMVKLWGRLNIEGTLETGQSSPFPYRGAPKASSEL